MHLCLNVDEIEDNSEVFRDKKSAASRRLKRLKQIATSMPESAPAPTADSPKQRPTRRSHLIGSSKIEPENGSSDENSDDERTKLEVLDTLLASLNATLFSLLLDHYKEFTFLFLTKVFSF